MLSNQSFGTDGLQFDALRIHILSVVNRENSVDNISSDLRFF